MPHRVTCAQEPGPHMCAMPPVVVPNLLHPAQSPWRLQGCSAYPLPTRGIPRGACWPKHSHAATRKQVNLEARMGPSMQPAPPQTTHRRIPTPVDPKYLLLRRLHPQHSGSMGKKPSAVCTEGREAPFRAFGGLGIRGLRGWQLGGFKRFAGSFGSSPTVGTEAWCVIMPAISSSSFQGALEAICKHDGKHRELLKEEPSFQTRTPCSHTLEPETCCFVSALAWVTWLRFLHVGPGGCMRESREQKRSECLMMRPESSVGYTEPCN